jgi:octaprenyl-diphosphate synthase
MLGEVSEAEKRTALREYGFNLGIMFQLVDDLLDFTGEIEALGKPIGGDLREGKITLPIIHLLQHGGAEADALVRGHRQTRDVTPESGRASRRCSAEHRSIDYAQARAVEFGERPSAASRSFRPPPSATRSWRSPTFVLMPRDR